MTDGSLHFAFVTQVGEHCRQSRSQSRLEGVSKEECLPARNPDRKVISLPGGDGEPLVPPINMRNLTVTKRGPD